MALKEINLCININTSKCRCIKCYKEFSAVDSTGMCPTCYYKELTSLKGGQYE